MARAPDPRIDEAKAMYLKGVKLVEIAHRLDLPEGTVRRWKSTHKWESERSDRKGERSKEREGRSRAIKTALAVHQETRKQLPQESLRLSFLIAWNRKNSSWRHLSRRIKSSCSSRRSGC
ncbi:MAG: phage terminase small subunit-related protein [Lachnospiraceae bacterium]